VAQRYFSINFGQTEFSVAETATTTSGADVELRVNLSAIPASENGGNAAVQQKMQEIMNFLAGKSTRIS
jgi:hypothetical protein